MLTCILLLIIFNIFYQYEKNQKQNIIELKKINIDYIDNENVISIISDSVLKEGVYLLKNESNNKPCYIFFKGKNNMIQDICLKLEGPSLEISANKLNTSSNEDKLLYEFIDYNNYTDVIITLKINKKEINLKTIIF